MKFKHQLVLKNSNIDVGLGPGVVYERELNISESTLKMINTNDPKIVWATLESNVALLMEQIEVKLVCDEEEK